MEELDKQETIQRYNERLKEFGYSEMALGWSRMKNDIRFEALICEWYAELEGSTIADFGCGFGDFYGFLINNKKLQNIRYTGIDINENLIRMGKSVYPESDFYCGDIIKDNYDQHFDFIFSSGVFNHKLQHQHEYHFIEETLSKLNSLTSKGFAVNFLSDKVDYPLAHTFHSNPGKILDICYKFSNNIVLRNDHMPYEFTVYMRKDKEVDREKVVYI